MPKIQMRRDTAENWKSVNPILLVGEWALETDTKKMKIGDGVTAYNALGYFRTEDNEWQKPTGWVDIRSGALPNSVYLLVGHSADYSSYPKCSVYATFDNSSNTYDVYVDGVKKATTASGTSTILDWQTLALITGWDVTHPANLRTHIVRITPTDPTTYFKDFSMATISGQANQCVLWAHFTNTNPIGIPYGFSTGSGGIKNPLLEAVTAENDELKIRNYSDAITGAFNNASSLVTIPVLVGDSSFTSRRATYHTFTNTKIKKLRIKDMLLNLSCLDKSNIKEIETNTPLAPESGVVNDSAALNVKYLKKFPSLNPALQTTNALNITNLISLEPTVLDLSQANNKTYIKIAGDSSNFCAGVKGLLVSNEAPFDSTTSPQLNVSYTGMDRAALVNLFNSMPTVTGGQVCSVVGCTGAADLTADDLAIATAKGWTVTR